MPHFPRNDPELCEGGQGQRWLLQVLNIQISITEREVDVPFLSASSQSFGLGCLTVNVHYQAKFILSLLYEAYFHAHGTVGSKQLREKEGSTPTSNYVMLES